MKHNFFILCMLQFLFNQFLSGQVYTFTTQENDQQIEHRILIDNEYYVETQFTTNPNQFIKTIGGFYQKKGNDLKVKLEFNSNFSKDS